MTRLYENQLVAEHFDDLARKRKAVPVAAIITLIDTLIPLFKKKPQVLWHWEGPKPEDWKKYGPFSARQCRKEIKKLVAQGVNPAHLCYYRPGITPPPYQGA